MTSDLRVVFQPLGKSGCAGCQLGMRRVGGAPPTDFGADYQLSAHAAGIHRFEATRQVHYADWISRAVARPPARILDVGCGNGSLLLALKHRWPDAELLGCDPAPQSVAAARSVGLDVWRGSADTIPAGVAADLIVSVNVVEHTVDPPTFLRRLRAAGGPGATIVVVCPDATEPGVELLVADHLYSLTPTHLAGFAAAVELTMRPGPPPPAALRQFQLAVAGAAAVHAPAVWSGVPDRERELNDRRHRYLEAWRLLDVELAARLPERVALFGAGEAAGLLRAYAPGVWSRVTTLTADVPPGPAFADLPFEPPDRLPPDTALLVAVAPAAQRDVAERLRRRFAAVVTWEDLSGSV
jgi:SAM-dependent methyltransferase